ncbi:putative beta-N-acetylglucosaminidase [Aspergillus undulatus]|uniref:putative beta-N-acetylglucosaminidase n=1 Tax=Aspergillus undulatus TaxID=1810928 RepID=UPI003CCCC742
MSQPQHQTNIEILPLHLIRDIPSISQLWIVSFPAYPLSQEHLATLIAHQNGHHYIARIPGEGKTIGFVLAYTTKNPRQDPNSEIVPTSGYLAVLAVHPHYRGRGIGTALVNETKSWFKMAFEPCKLEVGSGIPRFWPGVPVPVSAPISGSAKNGSQKDSKCEEDSSSSSDSALPFFLNRGFRMRPDPPRSVDLYRDIRTFSLAETGIEYGQRAKDAGYTFAPLTEDGYAECLAGQERNFGHNPDWVSAYNTLNPRRHPNSIMAAFSPSGRQIGWTLMLPPSSPILQENWAMPATCGPTTGLIGCVGIDKECRGSGAGIALVAHAMGFMRDSGIEGVFVDWVALEGFYERLGFGIWGAYRVGELTVD